MTTAGLERRAERRAEPTLLAGLLADPATRVLAVAGGQAPAFDADASDGFRSGLVWRAPRADDARHTVVYLGRAGGAERLAVLLPREAAGDDWRTLREIGADLEPHDAEAFVAASALANWHRAHGFCPRCGSATVPDDAGWTRRCPADGSEHFPRTDPAVIMAVYDPDDRLLLARHPSWPEGRLSVLAGFVEPGESLAMAVAREVFEEVGVRVADVRLLGDQPWPFPNSLMLGCEAYAADPALTIDPGEIAEAHWVTREEYRTQVDEQAWGVGTSISISRRLIRRWLDGENPPGVLG